MNPMALQTAQPERRILVVDDHQACCETTARLLRALGYQTFEAADQFQAESVLVRHPEIAALVVDLCLDPTGDLGFARRLRVDHPSVPVLFVSGICRDVVETLGLTGPTHGFLEKPFSLSQLEEALEGVLSGLPGAQGGSHARVA
jgi:CheY-like chemotaxis protein